MKEDFFEIAKAHISGFSVKSGWNWNSCSKIQKKRQPGPITEQSRSCSGKKKKKQNMVWTLNTISVKKKYKLYKCQTFMF